MMSALRGEGGPGKADEVREFSKGGCAKMRTRGGQKIGKFCGHHIWKPPLGHSRNLRKVLSENSVVPFNDLRA